MTPARLMSVLRFGLAVAPGPLLAQASEPAIADNSFFIEEAFNQEVGVVQHISALAAAGPGHRDLSYSFTQEWPFHGQRHQLSYTIPVLRPARGSAGLGDILLNYRRQFGAGDARWAAAPRLSLILPTGSVDLGIGDGTVAAQVNVPLSYQLTRTLVTHWNAGATFLPRAQGPARNGTHPRKTLVDFNLGASVIAPTSFPVQLMLESVINVNQTITAAGDVDRSTSWTLSPGMRAAINLGELQIVPGLAIPLVRSGGETEDGLLFYLSFEHPFTHPDRSPGD